MSELTPEQEALRLRVEASKLLDPDRWTISYTEHSATALRRRALGHGNGRSVIPAGVSGLTV